MTYTITARVYQTNTDAFFHVVEKTAWGTWTEVNGAHVLTMSNSGTCGSLRFLSDTDETFIVTLGVHSHKRWGDIVTNFAANERTGIVITPQYYDSEHSDRVSQRQSQPRTCNVRNDKGRNFAFCYHETEGNDLKVDIVIG
jgi:Fungal fruit body lectin